MMDSCQSTQPSYHQSETTMACIEIIIIGYIREGLLLVPISVETVDNAINYWIKINNNYDSVGFDSNNPIDSSIHWINCHLLDESVGFGSTIPIQ